MNKFRNSYLMLSALFMYIGFLGIANAQQASPQPKEVFGYYMPFDSQLYIEWQIHEQNNVINDFIVVLQRIDPDGTSGEASTFNFDSKSEFLKSMEIGDGKYYYSFLMNNYRLANGTYALTMQTRSNNGSSLESAESYFIVDDNQMKDEIYFTVFPETIAGLGSKYSSKIQASTKSEDIVINYELTYGPDGMTVDKNSGLIEFTPVKSGYVDYMIKAYDVNDVNKYADFYGSIYVLECETPGIISGKITYDESLEIKAGLIYVYQNSEQNGPVQVNSIDVNESGDFSLKLDKGDYFIYFMSYGSFGEDGKFMLGEWYKDALTIEEAEMIKVSCGVTTSIEMTVGDEIEYSKYKVSGKVLLDDGTPLKYANVVFESDNVNGDFWGGYYKAVTTDENGYYEVILPDLFRYKAYCYAAIDGNGGNFRPQYWKNTYNPLEATLLELKSDVGDINFIFNEDDFKYPDGSISGKVLNSSNIPIEGAFVIAFLTKSMKDDGKDDLYEGFAAITDENGEYKFDYMAYGEYILFAFPNDMTYAPGFYRLDDVASLTWEDATPVLHDGFNTLKDMDIVLPLMDIIQGVGKIEGRITTTGGGVRNDKAGDKLSGASIFLVSENGTTNKYNKSSNDGSYKVTGIAPGKYEFIVDKVGYKSFKEWVEVGEDGVISGHNIALSPETATSVDDMISDAAINVFPNPAISDINITFNAQSNNSIIEIYNILGVKVKNLNVNSINGVNSYNLNVSELQSGQYLIKVIDGKSINFDRFIINK